MKLLSLILYLALYLASSQLRTTIAYLTAPTPAPSPTSCNTNLINLMSTKGCMLFADLLTKNADVETTYRHHTGTGLTVFCPNDEAVHTYMPKYHNLPAYAKTTVLLCQAIPDYYSFSMLRSNNGVVNTLAPKPGAKKFYNISIETEQEMVLVNTGVTEAGVVEESITATIVAAKPVAVYATDEVLVPPELWGLENGAPAPYEGWSEPGKDYKSGAVRRPKWVTVAAGVAALVSIMTV